MVDIRIYRAAFVPVLVAIVTVMFSIQDRPAPLRSALAPDAFDAKGASATLREITRSAPERRAGDDGDEKIARLVEGRFQSLPGFETRRDAFSGEVEGNEVPMTNVIGTLSGESPRQVVLIAHRDSVGRPGATSAADTAVLLELAKVLAGVRHNRTIVFVSADGGSADSAGVRRFAGEYAERDDVDAALVIQDIGAARTRRPFIVPWSSETNRGSLQLLRTVRTALEREIDTDGGSASAAGQFLRLAWPLTLRPQGPLLSEGIDAVTLTASGEVPSAPRRDGLDRISRVSLAQFGKAALGTMLALDTAEIEPSPRSYLTWGRKLVPGWAVSLIAFSLLAPVLAAALDGFARARRRGLEIGHWIRLTLASGVPFGVVLGAAFLFELLDWLPGSASAALAPASRPSFAEATPALCALALLLAIAWLVLRPVIGGRARSPSVDDGRRPDGADRPEAAVAIALVLSAELLVLWFVNPFAVLLLVPAAHVSLLLALAGSWRSAAVKATAVVTVTFLPIVVLLYYGAHFDLGLDPSRYALLLVAGGGSIWNVVLVSLVAGSLLSVVLAVLSRSKAEQLPEITVRGPRDYAGPGSLGGTESALGRR